MTKRWSRNVFFDFPSPGHHFESHTELTILTKKESALIWLVGISKRLTSSFVCRSKTRTEGDCIFVGWPRRSVMPLSTTHNRSHSSTEEEARNEKECLHEWDEQIVMNHLVHRSRRRCGDSRSCVSAIDSSRSWGRDVKAGIFRRRSRCSSRSLRFPSSTCSERFGETEREKSIIYEWKRDSHK